MVDPADEGPVGAGTPRVEARPRVGTPVPDPECRHPALYAADWARFVA